MTQISTLRVTYLLAVLTVLAVAVWCVQIGDPGLFCGQFGSCRFAASFEPSSELKANLLFAMGLLAVAGPLAFNGVRPTGWGKFWLLFNSGRCLSR